MASLAGTPSSSAPTAGSCLHKRVSADNAGGPASSCLHKRVSSRELSGTTKFKKTSAHQRFSHFQLAVEHDTHDPVRGTSQEVAKLQLSFLRKRSKIVEILSAGDLVFALTLSGVCAVFCGRRRIAFLNTTPDEVIRSIFFNKANQSIITVSVYRADNFSSLKCRTTPIEYLRRGTPDAGFALFEGECFKWPGFVEFDDVNGKVLTYSGNDKAYRVWEMTNYEQLYRLPEEEIAEIKISPGIMLLILSRREGHVPLKILSVEDGATLHRFNHLLHRTKKVEFIEQFSQKLLVKQEGEALQIIDVQSSSIIHVPETRFMTPTAFIFLYENQTFLTFRNRYVSVWNFRGEMVTRFEDHVLWHPDSNTSNIYITSTQDYILSYCRRPEGDTRSGGTINISSISSGKCVAKLAAGDAMPQLHDVTSIFYNEERDELYVGTKSGMLYLWSL